MKILIHNNIWNSNVYIYINTQTPPVLEAPVAFPAGIPFFSRSALTNCLWGPLEGGSRGLKNPEFTATCWGRGQDSDSPEDPSASLTGPPQNPPVGLISPSPVGPAIDPVLTPSFQEVPVWPPGCTSFPHCPCKAGEQVHSSLRVAGLSEDQGSRLLGGSLQQVRGSL